MPARSSVMTAAKIGDVELDLVEARAGRFAHPGDLLACGRGRAGLHRLAVHLALNAG